MDKPILIIEVPPQLSTEAIIEIHGFLQNFMQSFESHYFYQLRNYYRNSPLDNDIDDIF